MVEGGEEWSGGRRVVERAACVGERKEGRKAGSQKTEKKSRETKKDWVGRRGRKGRREKEAW